MHPSPVLELNAFVPARDFALSQQFYQDLGFTLMWANAEVAQFKVGTFAFLLQKYYVKEHAESFMMSLTTEDADAWWAHFERTGLKAKYPKMMLKPPTLQPWGLRVLYLSDPTGVLWHISDRKKP